MTYVVDSSVAVKWVVPEVLSDEADRILAGEHPLIAPDLLQVEAANALWKKAARKEISGREAGRALEVLAESAIVWWPTPPLLPRALEIARLLRHPVYDCVYLALAERERARLLTADRRLIDRAGSRKLGVAITDLRTV